MKQNRGILFIATMIFTFIISWDLIAYGQEFQYISKNGVSLKALEEASLKGKISLIGETKKEKLKILLKKEDKELWFDVTVEDGKFNEEIWLAEGKGNYTATVLVHEYDRKYSYGPTVAFENIEEVNPFIVPGKNIQSNHEEIINLAEEITRNVSKDIEKAKVIYNWIRKNIEYDYDKFNRHLQGNFDNEYGALATLNTRKGVCYDYATLIAALGRSIGLQVKVVEGEGITENFSGLHAWNEIYIEEEERWINIDATFGSLSSKSYFDNEDFNKDHRKDKEY